MKKTGRIVTFKGRTPSMQLNSTDMWLVSHMPIEGALDDFYAYIITEFSIMPITPGSATTEHKAMLYNQSMENYSFEGNSGFSSFINFENPCLMASAYLSTPNTGDADDDAFAFSKIRDDILITSDLYLVQEDMKTGGTSGASMNYYIQLDQYTLSRKEFEIAMLRDLRDRQMVTKS